MNSTDLGVLTAWSLIVSIAAAIIAIASFVHSIMLRIKTKKETKQQLDFITYLIVNSAPDPQKLQLLVNEWVRTGKWHGMLEKDPATGNYHLRNYADVASRFVLVAEDEEKTRNDIDKNSDK
jgi:hypothetical protein